MSPPQRHFEPIFNSPFRNEREGRLRAFWRLLFQYGLYWYGQTLLVTLVLVSFAVFTRVGLVEGELASSPAFVATARIATLAAVVLTVWLACRFLDRRPFSELGLQLGERTWWIDFGFGLFVGALLMTGVFLVELAAGWVVIVGVFETTGGGGLFAPAVFAALVALISVGIHEELLFRGYEIKNAAEGLTLGPFGPRGAILLAWALSSIFFGLLHLQNPNATLASTVNIAFAGLLLGMGYVLTGRLAIPIGLHITWNFFQGNVFGFPISGTQPIGATFIRTEQDGPDVFTGGAFGPEAGLLVPAACVLGTFLILLWVRLRSGKATIQTSIAEPPIRKREAP